MKTITKRVLSVLTALVLLLAAIPFSLTVSALEYNGFEYYQCGPRSDQYIEINDTDVMYGDCVIPAYFTDSLGRKWPVTTLRTNSFSYNFFTSVTIPDTVTSLGGGYTFDGCRQMTYVKNSDNVKVIPSYCFANCDVLESVHIGDSVVEIEQNAFSGCPELTYLELPITIQEIGDNAFGRAGRDVQCAYYPGTAKQWEQVSVGYGIEEKVLCQPVIEQVTSTASGVQITISKRAAQSYVLYRQELVNGTWGNAKTVTLKTNAYTDKTAVAGRTYRYAAKASHGKYVTAVSEYSKSYTHLPATQAKVSSVSKGYKVSWSAVKGATKYIVYRRTGSGKWKTLKTTTARSYTDKTAKSGKTYQYGVVVVAGKLKSSRATTESVMKLSAPKTVKQTDFAKEFSNGWGFDIGIKVTWSKVAGAKQYFVYRREGNGDWMQVTITDKRSYTDLWVTGGRYYTYRVQAVKDTVTSKYATSKKDMYLMAPTIGAFKQGGGIYVNWSQSPGVKKYVVYRQVGSGKWKKYKTTTGYDFTDMSVKKGKTYRYRVVAVNGKHKSTYFISDKVKM